MIPGLGRALLDSKLAVAYSTDASNVDPWQELGSPAVAVQAQVFVGSGVKIGSTSVNEPAMLIRFHDGSTVDIFIAGKAGAAGGDGGDGDRHGGAGVGSFRGGGGGGGAGLNPGAKGLRYPESDPDADNTDGTAGTETAGGSGGVSDFGGDIPNAGYVAGDQTNRIAKNPAIMIWPADGHSITVNIWCSGEITAGGDGGVGGHLDPPGLPTGANDGEDGEDLPDYYDPAPGALTDHPAIGYRSGQVTLNILAGGAYPTIKGRVVPFTSLP